MNCPTCQTDGALVLFSGVECPNSKCLNYKPSVAKPKDRGMIFTKWDYVVNPPNPTDVSNRYELQAEIYLKLAESNWAAKTSSFDCTIGWTEYNIWIWPSQQERGLNFGKVYIKNAQYVVYFEYVH